MAEPDFPPSAVAMFARSFLPFIGTFGRAEIELAVAFVVSASEFHLDTWAPLEPRQVGEWLRRAQQNTPEPTHWSRLLANPLALPNFDDAIADGWLRFVGPEHDGRKRRLELTPRAYARLIEKGWVRRG